MEYFIIIINFDNYISLFVLVIRCIVIVIMNTETKEGGMNDVDISGDHVVGVVASGCESHLKKSYIVKHMIPRVFLFDFLEKICSLKEGVRDGRRIYFFITFDVYRKMMFEDLGGGFVEGLREYYLPCFQVKYLDKDLTYNRFNTLVRQVCKVCDLKWEVLEQQDELCKVQYIVWV